jgi:predicted porin
MKKMTILAAAGSALALSASIASAQESSGEFYGYILASVADNDNSVSANGQGANGPSRFGFRGTHELGNGLTAGATLEYAVSDDSPTTQGDNGGLRLANAHLSGDLGTAKVGTLWNPMYLWTTGTTDLFLSDVYNDAQASDTTFRQDSSVSYTSPEVNGLQFQGNATLEDGSDQPGNSSSGVDSYTVAAKYNFGDLYGSVSYLTVGGGDSEDADALGLAVSYDYGFGTLAASMTDQDDTDGVTASGHHNTSLRDGASPYSLVGTYEATDAWTLKAAYSNADRDGGDDSAMAVEAQYAFSGQVTTAIGLSNPEDNFDGTGDDDNVISAALFVAF